MMLLVFLLLLASPAFADDWYEDGQRVMVNGALDAPILFTSPGEMVIDFPIKVYAHMEAPYLKHCAIYGDLWDHSAQPEDRFITLYQVRTHYPSGTFRVVYGDNHPGRSYQVCIRLPYKRIVY